MDVIKVENLYKQYRLGQVSTGSIAHDLNRWWHTVRGKEDPYQKVTVGNNREESGTNDYVWALQDINFSVKQGEVLGIIGRNGAGKSTLLKILSKVTSPTKGNIKVKGKIASLLEVGTGFHPELTGRENIFLNGAILGMTKNEIRSKFDEIVDFAGIEKYVDTPVKRYSSGMYVRLAFAVAAYLDPEILIVDEVLAVGDAEFQQKAIGKMKSVSSEEGRTVLFVSHNMQSIRNLCTRGILLSSGMIKQDDSIDRIVSSYLNQNLQNEDYPIIQRDKIIKIQEGIFNKNNPTLEIQSVSIVDDKNEIRGEYFSNESIYIKLNLEVFDRISDLRILVELTDMYEQTLVSSQLSDSEECLNYLINERINEGTYEFVCQIPPQFLSNHRYFVTLQIINIKNEHYNLKKIFSLNINYIGLSGIDDGMGNALIRPKFNWKIKKDVIK